MSFGDVASLECCMEFSSNFGISWAGIHLGGDESVSRSYAYASNGCVFCQEKRGIWDVFQFEKENCYKRNGCFC